VAATAGSHILRERGGEVGMLLDGIEIEKLSCRC